MLAEVSLTAEQRRPFEFVLAVEAARLRTGTKEHQAIAVGLQSVSDALAALPPGPIVVALEHDEMYMLGVRNHVDMSELEEYARDNRASLLYRREPAPFVDEAIGAAIARFYPEVVENPEAFDFRLEQPLFLEIGFKIDTAMTEAAPRARGLYNKERGEIIRRSRADQQARAERRGRAYPKNAALNVWRPAVRVSHVGPGEMAEADLNGTRVLVANIDGEYYAIDGYCTHVPQLSALNSLANGTLDTDQACVTCPWHGAQFSLRSGKAVRGPYDPAFRKEHFIQGRVLSVVDARRTTKDVQTYATKIENGYVWVNVA